MQNPNAKVSILPPPPPRLTSGKGYCFTILCIVTLLTLFAQSVQADVTYSNYTFTGSGEYSSAVDAGSHNLTVTPTKDQTITLSGGVKTSKTLTHNYSYLVFAAGSTNSFDYLYVTNSNGYNWAKTTINGTVTTNSFALCNSCTAQLEVNAGATFTVNGWTSINDNAGAQGFFTQNGGTVNFNGYLGSDGKPVIRLGHWSNKDYPSAYNMIGGTLNIPNSSMAVGWDGYASFNITGGTANVKGLILSYSGGKGTLTLRGGTLNVGSDGIKQQNGNYAVYLGQGTISASANHTWSSNMTITMDGRSASDTSDNKNGYTTFDVSSGKTITLASPLKGVGGLKKTGVGTLNITASNTDYSGSIDVQGGTLQIPANFNAGSVISVNTSSSLNLGADATTQASVQMQGLTFNGGTVNFDFQKTTFDSITLKSTDALMLTNGTIHLNFVDDCELSWLENATDGYKIINGTMDTLDTSNITVSSSNWKLSSKSDGLYLVRATSATPYYDASSAEDLSSPWTIDGTNKIGAKLLSGTATHSKDVVLNSDGEFYVEKGATLTQSSEISGEGKLSKTATGTLVLTTENSYKGGTFISSGTVTLSNSGSLGTGDIVNKGTLNFNNNVTTTVPNAISGTGTINKNGTGTTTFTEGITAGKFVHSLGTAYFTAGKTYNFSTLEVNSGTGDYNGATLYMAGTITTKYLDLNSVANCTSHTRIGEGTSLTVTDHTYINQAKSAQAIVTQTGGTVQFTSSTDTSVRIGHWPNEKYPSQYNISGGTFSVPNTITYVGWDGYAELNITGGTVSLKGLKLSHSGGKGTLTLRGGKLEMGSSGVTMTSGKIAPSINFGQGTLYATDSHTWSNLLTINLYGRSATDSSDNANGATTIEIPTGKSITFASKLTGVGGISVTGGGTLNITGSIETSEAFINVSGGSTVNVTPSASTHKKFRQFNINGGTIQVNPSGTNQFSFDTTSPIAFGTEGGTLTSNCNLHFGTNATISTTENGKLSVIDGTGALNLNDKTITFNTANNSALRIDGKIWNVGTLAKSGNGTLELTYANTYSTGTTISAGVLKLSGNGTLGTGATTIAKGATLEFKVESGQTRKVAVGATEEGYDYFNNISTSGTSTETESQIVKSGDGDMKILLQASGQISVDKIVVSSGRLDIKSALLGEDYVALESNIDVLKDATFSPGNSVGILKLAAGETIHVESGSKLLVEVDSSGMDKIVYTDNDGKVDFQPGSIIELATIDGYTPSLGGDITETLFTNIPGIETALKKDPSTGNSTATLSSYYYQVNYNADGTIKSIGVNPNAVPEPSTWALLILGIAGLMWLKRKHERR